MKSPHSHTDPVYHYSGGWEGPRHTTTHFTPQTVTSQSHGSFLYLAVEGDGLVPGDRHVEGVLQDDGDLVPGDQDRQQEGEERQGDITHLASQLRSEIRNWNK